MKKTAKPSWTRTLVGNADLRAVVGGEEAPQDPEGTQFSKPGDRTAQAMDGYIRG